MAIFIFAHIQRTQLCNEAKRKAPCETFEGVEDSMWYVGEWQRLLLLNCGRYSARCSCDEIGADKEVA